MQTQVVRHRGGASRVHAEGPEHRRRRDGVLPPRPLVLSKHPETLFLHMLIYRLIFSFIYKVNYYFLGHN